MTERKADSFYLQYSKPDITSLKLLQASSSVKGFSAGISNSSPFSNSSNTKKQSHKYLVVRFKVGN